MKDKMKSFKNYIYLSEVKVQLKPKELDIKDFIRGTYKKNSDGSYDVNGNVDLSNIGFTKIPWKFNKISGSFICLHNELISLEGAQKEVGDDFSCSYNQLKSLEGAPEIVGNYFHCTYNQLKSLEGAPEKVGGNFNCSGNELTSLESAPKVVGGNFICINNSKKFTEEDIEKVSNVKGVVYV
jgi:hypothetical protein